MQPVALAIEASTDLLSVALRFHDGTIICKEGLRSEYPGGVPHVVAELSTEHATSLDGLRTVVVGGGPGSFTGIRAALAYATGVAAAAKLEIVMLPSLVAAVPFDSVAEKIIVFSSAGRGEYFVGRALSRSRSWTFELSDAPVAHARLQQEVAALEGATILALGESASQEFSLPVGWTTSSAQRLLIASDMAAEGRLQVSRQVAKNAIESGQLSPWYVRLVAARSLAERSGGARTPD